MATIGVATTIGSVGPSSTPDVAQGNAFVVGQTPWGLDGTWQLFSSFGSWIRAYGGLNKLIAVASPDQWGIETTDAVVQCYYNVKAYFAEKQQGSPGVLYFSRAVASSSGPVAASTTINDVSGANPSTFTSKWKSKAGNSVTVAVTNPSPRSVFVVGPGTIATTQGVAAITGTSTAFAATDVGKGIQILGVNYTIKTFSSATAVTIDPVYAATTGSTLAYSMCQPSCRVVAAFPQANISETFDIVSVADATTASQRSELVSITLPAGATLPKTTVATKLTGGTDGSSAYSASDADYIGTAAASGAKSGLQVFNDARLGTGYVFVPGKQSSTIRSGINTHVSTYYRLGLLSSPSGLTASTVGADIAGIASNQCAYYWPQIKVSDENSDSAGSLTISNEGAIAGLAARMIRDYNFGPHKSPAGITHPFVSVVDLERQSNGQELCDDGISNTLADSFINTLRIKGQPSGFVVWGNRTLATDKRWLQFNSAQTINLVYTTGQLLLEKKTFEPVDPQGKLFADIRSDFNVFLLSLFRKGALFGTEPDGNQPQKTDAFLVVCDRSNNPDTVLVGNEVHVDVTFAPTPNAEKITLNLGPAAPGYAGRAAQ
jgi:phage tail sheath protein FI